LDTPSYASGIANTEINSEYFELCNRIFKFLNTLDRFQSLKWLAVVWMIGICWTVWERISFA